MSNKLSLDDLPAPRLEDLPSPDQEMSLDSLPSPTIDNLPAPTPEWSKTQSFGQGALQGATLGFSDELGGALGAGMEKLAGNPDNKSWSDLYNEYRTFQRGRNEEASESNPMTYLGGNVAGGVASVPLMSLPVTGAGIVGAGAATGLGTSSSDLTGPNPETGHAAFDTITGGVLGIVPAVLGKTVINPVARKLGQYGQTLFGKGAQKSIKTETEALANQVVSGIKSEKDKVGKIYEQILDANKDKKIDLSEFVSKLKTHADTLDTSLPEQARDKKAIMDLILKVTEGPEVNKIARFQPGGPTKTKEVVTGFRGTKSVPEGPSAADALSDEAKQIIEQQRMLGNKATSSITPSEDNSMLTRMIKTDSPEASVSAKTVLNEPGSAARTDIVPIIKEQPFSTPIKPIEQTVREGGSLAPDVPIAKKLRSDLGVLAYEKNLSNLGEDFGQKTYKELTQTMKDQIPGLGPADKKYTELLNASRKLGIKGNDEDVVRVLSKMTSSNQGKEIIVEQALESLDKVNPKLADMVRNASTNLDQKIELVDKISKIGDFNVLNPKQLAIGLIKNSSAIKAAGSNLLGRFEQKLVNVPTGRLIQKPLAQAITRIPISPAIQESVQEFNPNDTHKLNNYLYNSTDDSLKLVGEKLKSNPGLEHYGETLVKAIERGDRDGKNKAIFVISQTPNARAALKEMYER